MSNGRADFAKPLRGLGEFCATALGTLSLIPRRPIDWREFPFKSFFIARVSVVPALLLTVPFTVLAAFPLTILTVDFAGADFAGTRAGISLALLGPIVTVLVVAGAAAPAIRADLGARFIRDGLDALRATLVGPASRLQGSSL
jgi:phospholipid/cholesterol/gamma-HCH transport system permease protein